MRLLLRDDVAKLGRAGDVVDVADGYARNFLLPRSLAFIATPENEKRIRAEQKRREATEVARLDSLKEISERLNGRSVTLSVRANEEQKLFGSVGGEHIAEAVWNEHGAKVEPRQVLLESPIQELGVFDVKLRLAEDAEAEIKVWVVEQEAKEEG